MSGLTLAGDAAPVAELIEDHGVAAAGEEFFRSRPFLGAEGVTHTLRIDARDGLLLTPVIVREIPGTDAKDAISPYGYPGFCRTDNGDSAGMRTAATAPLDPATAPLDPATAPLDPATAPLDPATAPLDPATVDFIPTGMVSLFVRHTIGAPPLSGTSERNIVQIADPDLPPKTRSSDRNQINKNRRNGYEVRIVSGVEASTADRTGFRAAYEETMRRAAAAERYFFGDAYFDRILDSAAAWLAVAHAPGGDVAAASIAVRSDGFIHYYLSGSADAHLRDSPMKNVVAALVELSAEQGLPLNLGGGISRGDRLEEFKRGFANREEPWHTSEIVCDAAAYSRLSSGREAGDFFPAYRVPQ